VSTIKLKDSQCCGQFVSGSGSASKYVTVLVSPSLMVAARFVGGKLSVRVETRCETGFKPLDMEQLSQLGLSPTQDSHFSVHFSGLPYTQAMMSLASLVAGIAAFLWQTGTSATEVFGVVETMNLGVEFGV
jgi:hypothetical protein